MNNTTTDANGWVDLSKVSITESSYSSLIGIPITSLENRNSSFVLETTYMSLDCDQPKDEPLINITISNMISNGTFIGSGNTDPNCDATYPSWQVALNQFVSDVYRYGYPEELVNATDADIPQATLIFQSQGPWQARCQINQIYVESKVTWLACQYQIHHSQAARSRHSENLQRKHAFSTVTTLSFPDTFFSVTQAWIMATGPILESDYSNLSEYYLQKTSTAFILSGGYRQYADYSDLTAQQFSQRLGQLLNT